MSVLLNNCFPFSIKIPVKYNRVLLVVNKMAKIPLLHKHLKDVFIKKKPALVKLNLERHSHANWKSTEKWSLTCFKSTLKILHSNYLSFCSNLLRKFAVFLKISLLLNSFYCLFFLSTELYCSIALKTRTAMNMKMSVFVIGVKEIIYLLCIIYMTVPLSTIKCFYKNEKKWKN